MGIIHVSCFEHFDWPNLVSTCNVKHIVSSNSPYSPFPGQACLATQIILHFVTFNVTFIVIFMAWQFNAVHRSQIGCFPRGQCQKTWAVADGVIH